MVFINSLFLRFILNEENQVIPPAGRDIRPDFIITYNVRFFFAFAFTKDTEFWWEKFGTNVPANGILAEKFGTNVPTSVYHCPYFALGLKAYIFPFLILSRLIVKVST